MEDIGLDAVFCLLRNFYRTTPFQAAMPTYYFFQRWWRALGYEAVGANHAHGK